MRRLVSQGLSCALVAPASSDAATFFLFDPASAAPNERVTVRTGATPAGFKAGQRVSPFQRAVHIYLVREDVAASVHSRLDPRLTFVGALVPDLNGRGFIELQRPAARRRHIHDRLLVPGLRRVQPRPDVLRATRDPVRRRAIAPRRCCASPRARRARSPCRTGTAPRASPATCPGTGTGCSARA